MRTLTTALLVSVTLALAGCRDKADGDQPAATGAATGAGQATERPAPTPPRDHPGVASHHGTAGETECFSAEACVPLCEAAKPGACDRLAEFYDNGWGVDRDGARASSLRETACVEGADAAACFRRLGDNDWPLAALEGKCNGGDGRACYVLARGASARAIDEPEFALAEAAFDHEACKRGYAYSCEIIGRANDGAYRRYNEDREALERRAGELRERDCDAGVALACESLAMSGDRARFARAGMLWKRQCARGYPPSCRAYAKLIDKKKISGTPADAAASRARACELGDSSSC